MLSISNSRKSQGRHHCYYYYDLNYYVLVATCFCLLFYENNEFMITDTKENNNNNAGSISSSRGIRFNGLLVDAFTTTSIDIPLKNSRRTSTMPSPMETTTKQRRGWFEHEYRIRTSINEKMEDDMDEETGNDFSTNSNETMTSKIQEKVEEEVNIQKNDKTEIIPKQDEERVNPNTEITNQEKEEKEVEDKQHEVEDEEDEVDEDENEETEDDEEEINIEIDIAEEEEEEEVNELVINAASSDNVIGIGGKGGTVYNVNNLKRNLLQETMKSYKRELWTLLNSPWSTEEDIVDKLASLVQGSPVRTTTDSNLLDGDWCLAYKSRGDRCPVAVLFDKKRQSPVIQRQKRQLKKQMRKKIKSSANNNPKNNFQLSNIIQTNIRSFHLEDLEDDQDPYVIDTKRYFGGIVSRTSNFKVKALTRSSIELDAANVEWTLQLSKGMKPKILKQMDATELSTTTRQKMKTQKLNRQNRINGARTSSPPTKQQQILDPMHVEMVYLDNDIFILSDKNQDKMSSPFWVYTQDDMWLNPEKRFQRKIRFIKGIASSIWKPIISALPIIGSKYQQRQNNNNNNNDDDNLILTEFLDKEGGKNLTVLRLGDVNPTAEDISWSSENDPFVHLSADERQNLLKTMNIQEIEKKGGGSKLSKNRRKKISNSIQNIIFGRRKKRKTGFKKPEGK